MHPHQFCTMQKSSNVATQITFLQLFCIVCVHATPVTLPIHLNIHLLTPIIKVKTPTPKVMSHLVAPLLTAPMCLQQLHELRLTAADACLA